MYIRGVDMRKEHWTIIATELVPWKPNEAVFIPEDEIFSFADLYRSVDTVNKELSWIMAQNQK